MEGLIPCCRRAYTVNIREGDVCARDAKEEKITASWGTGRGELRPFITLYTAADGTPMSAECSALARTPLSANNLSRREISSGEGIAVSGLISRDSVNT